MASCGMTDSRSLTNSGDGVKVKLRFSFRNLRGSNVDITDEGDL
jgi:hypothetical protein